MDNEHVRAELMKYFGPKKLRVEGLKLKHLRKVSSPDTGGIPSEPYDVVRAIFTVKAE